MELQDACARLHAEHPGARRWLVGFSGGMDSRVLLDLCHRYLAGLPDAPRLEALHVDHGVHADSARWARVCAGICEALGVSLHQHRLQPAGHGEDALRRARYAVFEQACARDDLLLLAHHRDDQAETVLLRLLRGAGPAGLAGMPASRACGAARLCRPLLDVPRERLRAHAVARGLRWIEDPSNEDHGFGRNVIRHELMPLIEQRWPGASLRIVRAAGHCAEAEAIVRERADADLRDCLHRDRIGLECLGISRWRSLPAARRGPVLRQWFRTSTGIELETDALRRLGAELIDAAPDRHPEYAIGAWRFRRHADGVYLGTGGGDLPPTATAIAPGDAFRIPGTGELRLEAPARTPSYPLPRFHIVFPAPGMRCRLAGRAAKPLRQALAEAGVPAWLRARVPLLFTGDELLAVAACGAAEGHAPRPDSKGEAFLFCWIPDGAQGEEVPPGVAFLP